MGASDQPPAPPIGAGTVLGKCEILRELGRGGMGTVYLAHHRSLDVLVAVKVLSPEMASATPAAAERFLREARLTARIRHPNLVGVMDTDTDPATGVSYLVMEYVDGPSVAGLIHAGPLDLRQAVRVALDVSRALEAASNHKVIHRDIKPANIMVAADGTVKLTDLGLAKDLDFQGKLTASTATLGTPLYMSPELVRKSPADIRSDIYSLGVTLFEMITSRVPFDGASFFAIAERITTSPVPDPRDWREEVDEPLAAIVMKMMAKRPEARYASPLELSRALSQWLGETPAEGVIARVSGSTGQFRAVAPPPPSPTAPREPVTESPTPPLPVSPPAPPPPPTSHPALVIVVALALGLVAVLCVARPELFRPRSSPSIMSR